MSMSQLNAESTLQQMKLGDIRRTGSPVQFLQVSHALLRGLVSDLVTQHNMALKYSSHFGICTNKNTICEFDHNT